MIKLRWSKYIYNKQNYFKMEPELPRQRHYFALLCLKPWNLKTGQNNLCTGPRTTLCPKELFIKITRKQL